MTDTTIGKMAFKGASWLAIFKLMSQLFSWVVTIFIARILVPGDYGLMAIATIITTYAEMFSELGLGAAIIQKSTPTQKELSSVFWIIFLFSLILSASCFPIAYITAYLFEEPRVIPLTQSMAIVFLLSGLSIVPFNLLKKDMKFKTVGIIEMSTTFIACIGMVVIALSGGGVWTFVGGRIIRMLTHTIIIYYKAKWIPYFHFQLKEAISYLRFGVMMSVGRSFFYIWEQSDKFFAGRAWKIETLGYYTFALQLAQLPTEKIVVLINQVSFTALSRLQNDKIAFNNFYLNVTKITATLVLPLFIGGFLVGSDLIKLLLNEKWYPIIFVFKYLCLSQIMMALNAVNNFAHAAQGRPQWGLCFHTAGIFLMPVSFYFSVQYGLNAILIPWFTTFIFMCFVWIFLTLKKLGIPIILYGKNLLYPILGAILMTFGVHLSTYFCNLLSLSNIPIFFLLLIKVLTGAILYIGFIWSFDKQTILNLKSLKKS